jgi:hypothetical protein
LLATNAAFAADDADFLTSPAGKDTLISILSYHVFPGIIVSSELIDGSKIRTLQGLKRVNVSVDIMFNNASRSGHPGQQWLSLDQHSPLPWLASGIKGRQGKGNKGNGALVWV